MQKSFSLPQALSTCLWGNTVALSWMWGLGLFFSVQFTLQFGLFGLLTFSIPNCLGLLAFGWVAQHIADRERHSESLAKFFTTWSRPFRLVFFLYQILAIALTIFACVRYIWQPLNVGPQMLYLPLTVLVILAASILFGEEFNIKRIKFSHGVLFILLAIAVGIVLWSRKDFVSGSAAISNPLPPHNWNFWGYAVPICIGFLLGPWLDLQQWQRAIQMQRERVSIRKAYAIGSLLFFALLLFHGTLAWWARGMGGEQFLHYGLAQYIYGHEMLVRFFHLHSDQHLTVFVAYNVFLCICILTTLDSGYIALRWFLQSNVKSSNHPIFSLISPSLFTSPIPVFIFCAVVALLGTILQLELEYFMIFYATFFVGYSALAIMRCYLISPANAIPQVKMFSVGSLAVVIFAYGYFLRFPIFQIVGSLLPLGYVFWLVLKPGAKEEFVKDHAELNAPCGPFEPLDSSVTGFRSESISGAGGGTGLEMTGGTRLGFYDLAGHFEGKWFVHRFVATYADTNSVGNVYFGMYAMWVGKTRELFFNKVMPKFNLKDTPFYILTRSFEHKFVRETREFEVVSVRIRIASYNRKFVTLEHEIYDSQEKLLGKGKQSLLFVSSSDYHMVDIPNDVYSAFVIHA